MTESEIRYAIENTVDPMVISGYSKSWEMCKWTLDEWCKLFGEKKYPFRCQKKNLTSEAPCWERHCTTEIMRFNDFLKNVNISDDWMYFDYKYMHQWLDGDGNFQVDMKDLWKKFGYPDKGNADTTIWVGSEGAHTPAHQDTYGYNIVVQCYGRKRWLLFPPESGGMKPTRVPYEESSVYSELNFYCPTHLDDFKGVSGCRVVELSAGDALIVPRGWWHYVQNLDPINISVNTWLPHVEDDSARVSEALIKIFIAQICKDLPQNTTTLLLNPNEDDLSDTPLSVLFLQLDTVTKTYLDKRRKNRRIKRQKTDEDTNANDNDNHKHDIKDILKAHDNIKIVNSVTNEDMLDIIKRNKDKYGALESGDEIDGAVSLRLTKATIDAFCDPSVLECAKEKLFTKLS